MHIAMHVYCSILSLYAGSYSFFKECCEKRMQVHPKLLYLVYLLMIGLILVGSLYIYNNNSLFYYVYIGIWCSHCLWISGVTGTTVS